MIGGAGSLMPMAAGSAAGAMLSTRRRDAAGRAVRLRGMQIEPPCIQLEVSRLLRADAATRLVNAWSRVGHFSIDMPHEAFHAPCFQTRV